MSNINNTQTLVSINDITAKYKISSNTIYYWIKTSKLKTIKIGRKHFINELDLLAINNGGAND